MVMKL